MTPAELLIYRLAAVIFSALGLAFIRAAGALPQPDRRYTRAFLALCVIAVLAMALVACGGSSGGPATPTPRSGPLATATPNGIPTPAVTPTPMTLYCPPPTADGHDRLCVVVEPTPGPATRAVYATRLAEWEALGTPTSAAWATADAYATALAAEMATALYTPAPGGASAP